MTSKYNQLGFAHIALIIALVAVLILGSVGVVGAANNTKPGDPLYPIDTGIENVRLALSSDPATQVQLRTEFITERLNEAKEILQEQGSDSPGIDVALANLTEHRAQIATLVAQNQELQVRIEVLGRELEQSKRGLDSAFESVKDELEESRKQAEKAGDDAEVTNLNAQLNNLENQRDDFDDEDEDEEEIEEQEAPEPAEEPELTEEPEDEEAEKDDEDKDNDETESSETEDSEKDES